MKLKPVKKKPLTPMSVTISADAAVLASLMSSHAESHLLFISLIDFDLELLAGHDFDQPKAGKKFVSRRTISQMNRE